MVLVAGLVALLVDQVAEVVMDQLVVALELLVKEMRVDQRQVLLGHLIQQQAEVVQALLVVAYQAILQQQPMVV